MAVRRVYVTGLGIVSPIGLNLQENWNSLLSCKSNITKLPDEYSHLPCKVASMIDKKDYDKLLMNIKSREKKSMSRSSVLLINAVEEALKHGGIDLEFKGFDKDRCGVSIGHGFDGSTTGGSYDNDRNLIYGSVGPYALTQALGNMSAAHVSVRHGLRGPCRSVNTACAAGLHSIIDGVKMISCGDQDLVIAGGTESCITPWSIAAFSRIRAMPTVLNSLSSPFDVNRSGFIMAEGAAVVILQNELSKDQIQSGIKPLAEIIGTASNCDASGLVSPAEDGRGAEACMRLALKSSSTSEVDYINAHATSTPLGDYIECRAISNIFNSTNQPFVGSMKGQLCHSLGAAGSLETVLTIVALDRGIMPPNANLQQPDSKIESNVRLLGNSVGGYQWPAITDNRNRRALKNSFGFGGTNASILLQHCP